MDFDKVIDPESPGYSKSDGSPDTIGDIIMSTRGFACALSHLLQTNEGVVIEIPPTRNVSR